MCTLHRYTRERQSTPAGDKTGQKANSTARRPGTAGTSTTQTTTKNPHLQNPNPARETMRSSDSAKTRQPALAPRTPTFVIVHLTHALPHMCTPCMAASVSQPVHCLTALPPLLPPCARQPSGGGTSFAATSGETCVGESCMADLVLQSAVFFAIGGRRGIAWRTEAKRSSTKIWDAPKTQPHQPHQEHTSGADIAHNNACS